MKIQANVQILKIVRILLLVVYIPFLLFYVGIVIPEYYACNEFMYEGQRGTDIWGNEVLCDGESQAIGKVFFQLATIIFSVFSIVIGLIFFFIFRLKKMIN
ncbi:hypothetical protein [Chryseobacterium sp.]|uniref:hypothetical protein n=1 Tax=Chryseobacterium sp. TaxID=1871047 RepID=UPI0028977633|nr:hypothetical protein [Chryseobacterium sp.]